MAQISKIERILNLVAFLLKERRPVPWRDIVGRVIGYDDSSDGKSLERRFERDKAALKELGVPVRFYPPGSHESEGYLIAREHCFLDPLDLAPQETALLNLVSELSLRRGERSPELLTALQKLRFDGPERAPDSGPREARPSGEATLGAPDASAQPSAWERSVLALDKVASLKGDQNLERLVEALLQNRAIRFTYAAISSGETLEREVEPFGLGFSNGAWYVVGRDRLRDAVRQFKLDRIRGRVDAIGAPGAFTVPAGFSVTEHLQALPWARGDDRKEKEPVEVQVLLDRDIAWFSEGPLTHKRREERADGSVVLTFDVVEEGAFLRWLLRHARHVHVLAPERLRQKLADALDALAARHGPTEQPAQT